MKTLLGLTEQIYCGFSFSWLAFLIMDKTTTDDTKKVANKVRKNFQKFLIPMFFFILLFELILGDFKILIFIITIIIFMVTYKDYKE